MPERCPHRKEKADPFSGDNPELMDYSVEVSRQFHENAAMTRREASLFMRRSFQEFVELQPTIERHSARYTAARMARASLARVISHRFAMNLAPLAAELVEGNTELVKMALQDPGFGIVASPRAGVVTDFNRTWYGDDARLIVTTGLLMSTVADETARRLPVNLRTEFINSHQWVLETAEDLAAYRGLETEQREADHFVVSNEEEQRRWAERHLLDALTEPKYGEYNGSSYLRDTDKHLPFPFVRHQVESVAEHTSAYLIDVWHAFTYADGDMSADEPFWAALTHLSGPSVASFMANQHNAEAEYEDRYVLADSQERGKYGSRREPLVLLERDEGYHLIPNSKSSYAKASRSKRNRCPGSDALEPREDEVEKSEVLRSALKSAGTAWYDARYSAAFDRPFTNIDVATIIGAAAARHLVRCGRATFDDEEVQRHLGPPESATSTGAYVLSGRK